MKSFEIIGEISDVETIAEGMGIREIARLRKKFGSGRWRKLKGIATIRLATDGYAGAKSIGLSFTAKVKRKSNVNAIWIKNMKTQQSSTRRFAICIDNSEYPASLELHKMYRVLADEDAAKDGDLRIVNESGEDYLYPADYFVLIGLPQDAVRTIDRSFAHGT